MASEFSRLTDRANSMEQTAIDQLLNRQKSDWEKRLYDGRGTDQRQMGYYKYPLELMSENSHMGAMVFEIYDTNPEHLVTKRNPVNLINPEEADKIRKARQAAEQGGGGIDLADIAGAAGSAIQGGVNQFLQGVIGAFAGGTIAPDRSNRLAQNSFVEEVTGLGGGTSRVGARIYLYIPNNIEAGYGFEYETTNMSALDVLKLPKALAEGSAEAAQAIGRKIAMANMKVLDSLAEKAGIEAGTLAKSIEASQRQIANPMQLHLFKEVKRRSFSFAYTFLPKSREEMLNCHAIINLFKYYSHPATSGAGRFLDYPAEFQIKFFQQNYNGDIIVNGYLPYIFKCALTGIKVTYGEDTVMSTFWEDANGAPPTKVRLELTFDELEVLTRDRFTITPGAPNP